MAIGLAHSLESRHFAPVRALVLALLLTGCVTTADFSRGMDGLVGQPVQAAFDRLGYPERQEVIAGRTIYYYGTDHDQGPSCTFKLVTDGGVIRSWDGIGNAAGCNMYLRGLR